MSTNGQTWTELEGPHLSHDAALGRAKVELSGLAVQRGDDGDVRVDQVGLP